MSRFKGDNGSYLTQALFYEFNNPDAEFTLRDTGKDALYTARSGKTYRSLAFIYRNSDSEYDCAINTLGSWEHWKKLCKQSWFMEGKANGIYFSGLNDWRAEKELADEAKAKKVLLQAIEDGDVQAAKFMYDKATKKTTSTKGVGRPEKKVPSKTKSSVLSIAAKVGSK